MADAISIQELIDARTDAKTLEEAVNGDAVTTVLSRLGESYPTLANALSQIDGKLDSADTQIKQGITNLFENGGLPATPFETKALMEASALVDGDYAMVTDDTTNNGLYIKTAGAWVKSGYDPVELAKDYTDEAIDSLGKPKIHSYALDDLTDGTSINAQTGAIVTGNSWRTSDFISVKSGDTLTVQAVSNSALNSNIIFYNENQEFIYGDTCSTDDTVKTAVFTAEQNGFIKLSTRIAASTIFSATLVTQSEVADKKYVKEQVDEAISLFSIESNAKTLTRIRARLAQIKTGNLTAQARIGFTGDSWTEFHHIPTQLKNIMTAEGFPQSGTGWIGNNVTTQNMDGVTRASTGTWTRYDINSASSLPTNGCGVDGVAYTSSQAGSKNTYSNIVNAENLRLFYGNSDGVFKYKLNNGEAITITSSSANPTYNYVDITGLSASNTLEIEVISGTVTLHGLHARNTELGIEINKIGNGSTKGVDWIKVSPEIQTAFASYLSLDLLIVILGTNDYRNASGTVASFKEGITKIVAGHRAANPDLGVILVAPPRTSGTAAVPLIQYRDAIIELSKELNCEYYNAYDDFNTYVFENENGQYLDGLHLNDAGAHRFARTIYLSLINR